MNINSFRALKLALIFLSITIIVVFVILYFLPSDKSALITMNDNIAIIQTQDNRNQTIEVEYSSNETFEIIAIDVARFYPDISIKKALEKYPSFAIVPERPGIGTVPLTFQPKPVFEVVSGRYTAKISVEDGTSFYGAGEIPGRLLLNGRKLVTWPTDDSHYNEHSDRCYQAHPYVLALRKDGSAYGIIFDTTYMVTMDFEKDIVASCAQSFSVVIISKKTPQEVVTTLAELTGKIPLPPKWSLGYHQCRWSYYPQSKALSIAQEFRQRKIPADVIWFDIHYMDGYRIFTFSPKDFPSPEKLNEDLHNIGFRSVWMIDPGVKQEAGYFVHDQLIAGDMAVKTSNGDNYVGSVWPGKCVFPDFTMEKTREWWAGLYKDYLSKGIDGVWNDMNEPSIFDSPTKTMPETNYHRGYGGGNHSRFHNVYGMLMAKSTMEGILRAKPDKRPFVLSRANYLGGQKYSATWTGDNQSQWIHLQLSIPMILNLGLSGQPFSGPDIGGFSGNADPVMFGRWMGFGALLPFSRGHTHHNSDPHEPWAFGKQTEDICRVALSRRYMLLPYFYTLFFLSSRDGIPVAQPLFFVDPVDPKLRGEDRAFMLGEYLLVVVNVYPDVSPSPVEIPSNVKWYSLKLDDFESTELPDLKIRAGGIIPIQAPVNNTDEIPEYIGLIIALDEKNTSRGLLYHDEGDGFEYKKGKFLLSSFEASLIDDKFVLKITEEGNFPRQNLSLKLRIILNDNREITHTVDTSSIITFSILEIKLNL